MIEKITPEHILGLDGLPTTIMPDSAKLMRKINELVDAVNELQTKVNKLAPNINFAQPEVKDKFAEQRKWIGKLCWFWDDEYDKKMVGTCDKIWTTEEYPYKRKESNTTWKHCEPVKPDDDIIYKGE